MEKILAKDWLTIYPDAFQLRGFNNLKDYLQHNFDITPLFGKAELKLSGRADIFAYLFFHSGYFLKEGGRMGIVTSNAWLDVAYGYELQKFFLKNFKIIAIVESRCEPWFEDVDVNTIFTILEKCSSLDKRQNHLVKFVKLKKKLKELIPWDMKYSKYRWEGINELARNIESVGSEYYKFEAMNFICTLKGYKTYEDDNFRVRILKQSELLDELDKKGKTCKWGKYLRAPEVYFDIIEKCRTKLVPLKEVVDVHYGIKTGINDFFYLDAKKINKWGIENDFLKPIIKSPKELNCILINYSKLRSKVFICNKSKQELRKKEKKRALKYIEWGEKQKTKSGTPWPEVKSVKGRKYWWQLGVEEFGDLICMSIYGDRFLFWLNQKLLVDHTLYNIYNRHSKDNILIAALLNCTITPYFLELGTRTSLGGGALSLQVYEASDEIFIVSPDVISNLLKQKIKECFLKISIRQIKPISEEIKMKDRQELDSAILKVLGLDPKVYLPKIYEGLCELVRERLELPKMRNRLKKTKIKRDIKKLKEDVIMEIIPDEVKKFPEDFWDINIKGEIFKEVILPDEPLKISQPFFGEVEISSLSGFSYKTKNPSEVKYIKYAKFKGTINLKIPQEPISIFKTITNYERYIRDLKKKLFETFYNRTHNQKLSHLLVQSILEELKIPEIQG